MVDKGINMLVTDRPYAFAVGDKVRYVGALAEIKGAVGTVTSLYNPSVQWPYYFSLWPYYVSFPLEYAERYDVSDTFAVFKDELELVK